MTKRMMLIFTVLCMLLSISFTAAAQTTISYLGRGSEEERQMYMAIFEEFERLHPDYRVEVEWGAGDAHWIYERLSIQIAAGVPPDVFWVHSFHTGDLAEMGVLQPIDDFLARDADLAVDDFFPPPLGDFSFHGTLYGLPRETSSLVLYYNQEMFDQAGVLYPDMSWSWDTLVDSARKLTRRTGDEVAAFGMRAPTGHDAVLTTVWQNEGRVMSPDLSQATFSSPESVEAHEWILSLMYESEVAPRPGQPGGGNAEFMQNRLGMLYGIRAQAAGFTEDVRWDVAHLPQGRTRATRIASSGHAIYRGTGKMDASWDLLKFLSGPFAQSIFASGGLSIPALREVAFSDAFLDPTRQPHSDQIFLDALAYARSEPVTPGYFGLLAIKNAEMPALWARNRPAYEVLSDVDRRIDLYLAER